MDFTEVEEKICYEFKNKKLLTQAFVHRSFYNENRERITEHNERLEFLGDSVLSLLISDYLFHHLPTEAEGLLSQIRAHLVESSMCARFLIHLGLSQYVLLGRGEKMNQGRGRETILADLFEAIIGAIYLDGGLPAASEFFWRHFQSSVDALVQQPLKNWKADLQDYSQKKYQKAPLYKVEKEEGPDHHKIFHVVVYLEGGEMGRGTGSSKKEAEQAAAQSVLEVLNHG